MQLIMRRPEVNKFVTISPQPNLYDFTFLSPCPISGIVLFGKNDELVQPDSILNLKKRLSIQKNIDVKFEPIANANHFFKNKENELALSIDKYIKDKVTIV
jgi:alpha/beta superfamily hydrolase